MAQRHRKTRRLLQRSQRPRLAQPLNRRRSGFVLESLETRCLLAGDVTANLDPAGNLSILGSPEDDQILVSVDLVQDSLTVANGPELVGTFPLGALQRIQLNSGDGDDFVNIVDAENTLDTRGITLDLRSDGGDNRFAVTRQPVDRNEFKDAAVVRTQLQELLSIADGLQQLVTQTLSSGAQEIVTAGAATLETVHGQLDQLRTQLEADTGELLAALDTELNANLNSVLQQLDELVVKNDELMQAAVALQDEPQPDDLDPPAGGELADPTEAELAHLAAQEQFVAASLAHADDAQRFAETGQVATQAAADRLQQSVDAIQHKLEDALLQVESAGDQVTQAFEGDHEARMSEIETQLQTSSQQIQDVLRAAGDAIEHLLTSVAVEAAAKLAAAPKNCQVTTTNSMVFGSGNDFFLAGPGSWYIDGGAGTDILIGNSSADEIHGGSGFDVILGRGGDDALLGDDDTDLMFGEQLIGSATVTGNDCMRGGTGVDFMLGDNLFDNTGTQGGDDEMQGGKDVDIMFGDDASNLIPSMFEPGGRDKMYGDDDIDIVIGNGNDDLLEGGLHIDLLVGNEGDDTIYARDNTYTGDGWLIPSTQITLGSLQFGGPGLDKMYGADGVDIQLGQQGQDEIYGKDYVDLQWGGLDNDKMYGEKGGVIAIVASVPIRFGNVMFGNQHNDEMWGGGDLDVMLGNADLDKMYGYDGVVVPLGIDADWMFGNDGDDTMEGDGEQIGLLTSFDFMFGNDGDDTMKGGNQADWMMGGNDNDTMEGDSNALWLLLSTDIMFGQDGADTMDGGNSSDLMLGGDGTDTMQGDDETVPLSLDAMFGQAGADTMNGGSSADVVAGNDGSDTILGDSSFLAQILSFDLLVGGPGNDMLQGGNAADLILGNADNDNMFGDNSTFGQISPDVMLGGDGDDRMDGGVNPDFMYGDGGCDWMMGDNGAGFMFLSNDVMFGGADCDEMYGGRGVLDIINGNDGRDKVEGQWGNDIMTGGDGTDEMNGGPLLDIISGGNHGDLIHGNDFIDVINGNDGNDCLYGDDGWDSVNGNSGDDCVFGGNGWDLLTGGDNNDQIEGNAGNDRLAGNDGDDKLWGGAGADRLLGQNGNDDMWGGTGIDWLSQGAGSGTSNGGGPNSGASCTCTLDPCKFDFGDAVTVGQTLLAGGARHGVQGPRLGALVDFEPDGLPTANADGDDVNGADDEDGVSLPSLLIGGSTPVTITLSGAGSAFLDAWVDFNGNSFFDPTEQVAASFPLSAGANTLNVATPNTALPGNRAARFRVSSKGGLGPAGMAIDGEVEDYLAHLERRELDFGDAPDSYQTSLGANGARHTLGGPRLGLLVDATANGVPSPAADSDDNTGSDDEDGVIMNWLNPGGSTALNVFLSNAVTARLDAWVDFNGSGVFDPSEQIFAATPIVAGNNNLSFAVPASSVLNTYARFRVTPNGFGSPVGFGGLGEVEDYLVFGEVHVFDWGDAPDVYFTTSGANGPSHQLGGPQLGNKIDFDGNGQPSAGANADDTNGTSPDDEDGVVFGSVVQGGTGNVAVKLTNAVTGQLDAWIDFNGDGDFVDAFEQVALNATLTAGINNLTFPVPISSVLTAYARFRVSTTGGLPPLGPGGLGEVEDHQVQITPGPSGLNVTATQFAEALHQYDSFMSVPGQVQLLSFAGQTGVPDAEQLSQQQPPQQRVNLQFKQQPGQQLAIYGQEGDPAFTEDLDGYDGSYMPHGSTVLDLTDNHLAPYFEMTFDTPVLAAGGFVATGKEGTIDTLRIRAYDLHGRELLSYDAQLHLFADAHNREGFWAVKMDTPDIARVTIQNLNETNFGNVLIVDNIKQVRPATTDPCDPCDFNGDAVADIADLNLLHDAVLDQHQDPLFDVNGDGVVDHADLSLFVRSALHTDVGDANLDGEFNSSDIVEVFQEGQYELDSPASWSQGDWNADGRFDSGDIVSAFQAGWYETGPLASTAAADPDAALAAVDEIFRQLAVSTRRKPIAFR